MKKISRIIFFLIGGVLALIPGKVSATHALGADITFEYVSPNVYNVYYSLYRDCAGVAAYDSIVLDVSSVSCGIVLPPLTLYHSSSCVSPSAAVTGHKDGEQLPGVCGSQANNTTCSNPKNLLPGVQVYIYCGQVTLPQGCSDWVISHDECCRNQVITNISNPNSVSLYVSATINNTNGIVDNSPYFTTDPSQIFCAGFYNCFNNGAVDFDGDSMAFSLVAPEADNGVPITAYNGNLSPTNPMTTTGNNFTFDPATGQICFTPNQAQNDVIAIQVDEYRTILGVVTKIGSTRRDMEFNILANGECSTSQPTTPAAVNPVGGRLIDSTTIGVCHDNPVSFSVISTDPNGDPLQMTSNIATAIPGATFTITGTGTASVKGAFSWTPTLANVGTNFFTVSVSNNSCPIPGSSLKTIKVIVYDSVTVVSSAPAACGDSVQLTAVGGSTFNWMPTTGLSNPTSPNPKAMPSVPTVYHVKTDCGQDSILVGVGTPIFLSVTGNSTICLNGTKQLNAAVTGGAKGDSFVYTWSPATPSGIISDSTLANPVVSPSTTTEFYVKVLSSEGCVLNDSVLVSVSGSAPNVTVAADPTTICPGGTVQLQMNIAPTVCGANNTPCTNTSNDYTIGNGSTFDNPSGANGQYPDIYGFTYSGAKHQILYKAADLHAQGLTGGTITKISFDVAQVNGRNHLCFFDIKMKCTNLNSLVNWDANGLTEVYTPKSVTVAPGWNTYVFDNPYDWDGVSDLLVDICYNNDSSHQTAGGAVDDCIFTDQNNSANNTVTYYSPTSYFSVIWVQASFVGDLCTSAYTHTISAATGNSPSTHRPNTIFSVCSQSLPGNATISWTPAAGVSNPNILNPTAQVFQNTTYVANVTVGNCTGSGFVNVTVNNGLKVTATPMDTSFCNLSPITLNAVASGAQPSPIPLVCGPNTAACGGAATQYIIGDAGGSNDTLSPFNGSQMIEHLQMIYHANELKIAGLSKGIIENIAFDVTQKFTTQPFQNFTIKIGCTAQNELTANFVTGLTQVYSSLNYSTVAGWNDFALSPAFDWDGVSNIIVEICFTNPAVYTTDDAAVTPTGFNSTLEAAQSFTGGQGCNIATGYPVATRPNIRFNECPPPPGTFHYTWTAITGPPDTLTGSSVTVNPTATVSYRVQLTDSFCYVYDTVNINVLNGYPANLTGRKLGCGGTNTGDISSTPTLGVSPYTFVWTDANGNTLQTTNSATTDTLKNLASGLYYVNLTDANGCKAKDSIHLIIPPPLAISSIAITNVTCYNGSNGSITVTATGGTPGLSL